MTRPTPTSKEAAHVLEEKEAFNLYLKNMQPQGVLTADIPALLMEKFIKEWGRKPTYMEIYAELIKNTIDLGLDKRIQGNGMLFLR